MPIRGPGQAKIGSSTDSKIPPTGLYEAPNCSKTGITQMFFEVVGLATGHDDCVEPSAVQLPDLAASEIRHLDATFSKTPSDIAAIARKCQKRHAAAA